MTVIVLPPLKEFLACIDVLVELPAHLTIHPTLAFGPFNTAVEAYEWIEAVENVYVKRPNAPHAVDVYDTNGLPKFPLLDFQLSVPRIVERPRKKKKFGTLFSVEKPEVLVPKLGNYAIRSAFARLEYAVELLDNSPQE